jgi:hypothetical protein
MKVNLSMTIGAVVLVAVAGLTLLAYRTSSQRIEETYFNEIITTTQDTAERLADFYQGQLDNVEFLTGNAALVELVSGQRWDLVSDFLKGLAAAMSTYENLFVFTVGDLPTIVADSTEGTAIGTPMIGIVYDETVLSSLSGEIAMSPPRVSPR